MEVLPDAKTCPPTGGSVKRKPGERRIKRRTHFHIY